MSRKFSIEAILSELGSKECYANRWLDSYRDFASKQLLQGRPDHAGRRINVRKLSSEISAQLCSIEIETTLSPQMLNALRIGFLKRIEHMVAGSERYEAHVDKMSKGQNIPDLDFEPLPSFVSIDTIWAYGPEGERIVMDIMDTVFLETVLLAEKVARDSIDCTRVGETSPCVYHELDYLFKMIEERGDAFSLVTQTPRALSLAS